MTETTCLRMSKCPTGQHVVNGGVKLLTSTPESPNPTVLTVGFGMLSPRFHQLVGAAPGDPFKDPLGRLLVRLEFASAGRP